jgi:hypothetical protein
MEGKGEIGGKFMIYEGDGMPEGKGYLGVHVRIILK